MSGIFKAYDIRGIYGKDLTDNIAYSIGKAYVTFLGCRKVIVGNDMRPHSIPLLDALCKGITELGCDVIRIGLCSTPMCYYAIGSLGADGGIMITASHNSGEWNGFKLCREKAIPISGASGIADIEKIATEGTFASGEGPLGTVSDHDVTGDYCSHVAEIGKPGRTVRIAADFGNAMGAREALAFKDMIETDGLYETLDGSFPNHEANPLKQETLSALREKVKGGKYDFGVAFDGDADRAGFVDERGEVIPMDMITALIAKSVLQKQTGTILYDLRSSKAVKEVIEENNGTPLMCRVGHAFIKQQMREVDAQFAGELSGHYYFKHNYYTESSSTAVLHLADILSRDEKPLSTLIKPFQRYAKSDEINSQVADVDAVFDRIRDKYKTGKIFELDGLSVEFEDWWFNVRASNTEPLVRLNLEADSKSILQKRIDEVLQVIRS